MERPTIAEIIDVLTSQATGKFEPHMLEAIRLLWLIAEVRLETRHRVFMNKLLDE